MVSTSTGSNGALTAGTVSAASENAFQEFVGQLRHRRPADEHPGAAPGAATATLPRGLDTDWPTENLAGTHSRELADWQRALEDREADLRVREAAVDGERTDLRERLHRTHAEARRLLADLRSRLDFERDFAADEDEPADESVRESFAADRQRLERLLEELLSEPRTRGAERARPPRDPAALRADLSSLRAVANESARRAIRRHFWTRKLGGAEFKLLLTVLSFALMSALYARHNTSATFGALAWGAGSIGLITLSSLGTAYRRKVRNRAAVVRRLQPDETACEPGALTDPGIGDKTEIEFDTWTG